MMYLLAIFVPPLAVLLVGRPIQAVINLALCFLLYIPGLIHALMVVSEAKADKRNRQLIKAMKR